MEPGSAAGEAPRANWAQSPLLDELGRLIFFDQRLSQNLNQACAVCHGQDAGWTGPDMLSNLSGGIYEGSVHNRFGNRKAGSSAYNVFAPVLSFNGEEFVGGGFWDGRATGWKLGSAAADQAQGPFLNPVEQALADGGVVLRRVCRAPYGVLFRAIWGFESCADEERGYDDVARTIAAFEQSRQSSSFRSKYDAYLAGEATLSAIETRGLELFSGVAKCSKCHTLEADFGSPGPLFSNFTYENLGVPRNISNPFYRMSDVEVDGKPINPLGFDWIDPGLGGFIETLAADDSWRSEEFVPDAMLKLSAADLVALAKASRGKHKVPSLRNVAKRPFASFVKSYTHNGYFKTLEGLVHFYNTRDVLPTCAGDFPEHVALALKCWPVPEVAENVNREHVGALGLSPEDEAALVAFLATLSDDSSEQ